MDPAAANPGKPAWVVGDANYVVQAGRDVFVNVSAQLKEPVAETTVQRELSNRGLSPASFAGRTTELDRLDELLDGPGQVVVFGPSGIGKTALVAQWVATRVPSDTAVWWISAVSRIAVQQGLAELAIALQPIAERALPTEQLAEHGVEWLSGHDGWVLVLDDVADPIDIRDVLARTSNTQGRLIITSRLATGWQGADTVRVGPLDPVDSLDLLTDIVTASGPRNMDGAEKLSAELGHLPLAVEQAAAYLAQNPAVTPATFLALITPYLGPEHELVVKPPTQDQTLVSSWRLIVDQIASTEPRAVELLLSLAWYAPDRIPDTLIDVLAEPPIRNSAMSALSAYNLIYPDPVTGTVSIHRLIQAIARTPASDDDHRTPAAVAQARARATDALAVALPGTVDDPMIWPAWRALITHVEALAENTEPDTDTATTATVFHNAAEFLDYQGFPTRAIPLLDRALADRTRILGDDHSTTMDSRNSLAGSYISTGRLAEAIPLYEQTLADRERVFGTDHPATLDSRNDLANAYRSAGELDAATALIERTVADAERVLGLDHPATLTYRINLASAYRSSGLLSAAIALLEQTLADAERVLGDDRSATLASRNNLASAYQSAGRLDEAIRLYERTLTDSARILGPDHPNTLTSRSNLASVYQTVDRLDDAIQLYERTLTDRERVLGPDHPNTLTSRNNLAYAYESVGRLDEAIQLYERTITDSERILGSDHPDTLTSKVDLAHTYAAAGQVDAAIALYETAIADAERRHRPNHIVTETVRSDLANVYRAAGRLDEAIVLLEQILSGLEQLLGQDHPETLIVRNSLADSYRDAGEPRRAIGMLEQTLATAEFILGSDHPLTRTTRTSLALAREAVS